MGEKFLLTPGFVDRLAKMLAAFESSTEQVWFKPPVMDTPPIGGVKFRQGTLDSTLAVGGSASVSIWKNSSTDSYLVGVNDDDGEDTGDDWENCASPGTQSSEIVSGTWVTVVQVGSERLIIMAACPEEE